jgi:hypothetical protein
VRAFISYGAVMRRRSRSEIYGDKAQQCVALAARTTDPSTKERLLDIAKKWQALAADAGNVSSKRLELVVAEKYLERRTS